MDSADAWTRAGSAEAREGRGGSCHVVRGQGSSGGCNCHPSGAGPAQEESRREGAKVSGLARPEREGQRGKKKAKRAKSEEMREKRKKFLFFF